MRRSSSQSPGELDVVSLIQGQPSPGTLRELLHHVVDPEIGINIVDLGLVYDIGLSGDGVAAVRMTLTTPGCPLGSYIGDAIRDTLWGVPGVNDVDVQIVWVPPWDPETMMTDWAKGQLGWNR